MEGGEDCAMETELYNAAVIMKQVLSWIEHCEKRKIVRGGSRPNDLKDLFRLKADILEMLEKVFLLADTATKAKLRSRLELEPKIGSRLEFEAALAKAQAARSIGNIGNSRETQIATTVGGESKGSTMEAVELQQARDDSEIGDTFKKMLLKIYRRHVGDFWRRSPAAGDFHRSPPITAQLARRRWKAIFIRYGSRRGGFVQASGDEHLGLLDDLEEEFERIACSRWIGNGVQLKFEDLLILIGPEVLDRRCTAVAQSAEASPSPSCARVDETFSSAVFGRALQPRSMADGSIQRMGLRPQPNTVHDSPPQRVIENIMNPQAAAVDNSGSSSAEVRIMENSSQPTSQISLQDVHKEVVAALAPERVLDGVELPPMSNDASFRDFMSKLVKSGSDKGFMHQKKYQKMMEPILEEQAQPVQDNNDDGSIDMVDYDSSDNEGGLQEEEEEVEHIQGATLALGVPSLEHERTTVVIPVDGSQPEAENLQEDMQEGLTQEDVQGTSGGGSHSAAEASQLNQGADALLSLAAGAVNIRTDSAGASNVPRLMNQPDDDMDIDGDKEEDADNLAD
ncbi:hypothetical protein ACQ4PT_071412 [Festuca glaucescens]